MEKHSLEPNVSAVNFLTDLKITSLGNGQFQQRFNQQHVLCILCAFIFKGCVIFCE
jgi:hypothetical protein